MSRAGARRPADSRDRERAKTDGAPADFQLYLASQSPRRSSLLRDIGIPFSVVPSDAEEATGGSRARAVAEANALAKVEAARIPAEGHPGAFVLGTDTVVSLGRQIMGKPHSAEEAADMLTALAGRTHRVISGVALARVGTGGEAIKDVRVSSACTKVRFARLDEAQVESYVGRGEWKGKAGGYAVQGIAALFVVGLSGEYSNVVGLPLQLLHRLFRESGFDLVRREWTAEARGTRNVMAQSQ